MTHTPTLADYLPCTNAADRPGTLDLAPGIAGVHFAKDTKNLTVWDGSAWQSPNSVVIDSTLVENAGTLAVNLDNPNTWTKAQRNTPVTLSFVGNVATIDMSLGNNFTGTLTASGTIANPINMVAGQSGLLALYQGGSGGNTVAWGSAFRQNGTAWPTLSSTVGAVDIISIYTPDGTRVAISQGYSSVSSFT